MMISWTSEFKFYHLLKIAQGKRGDKGNAKTWIS